MGEKDFLKMSQQVKKQAISRFLNIKEAINSIPKYLVYRVRIVAIQVQPVNFYSNDTCSHSFNGDSLWWNFVTE